LADGSIDATLQTATDNGNFDATYNKIMTSQLVAYQQSLAKHYDETSNQTAKQILKDAYAQAKSLAAENTDATP